MNTHNKIFNFGAGPACLPAEVLAQIKADIPDWFDGMSVMEVSHRSSRFIALTEKIEQQFRELLNISDEFAICFMQGGARAQFSAVPLNLLNGAQSADYCVTGHWSLAAYTEAKRYCQPNLVFPLTEQFTTIPNTNSWHSNQNAPYLHFTDNETIHGIEFPKSPECNAKWLISDMTSNIMSRPIDLKKYGLIYASAQKNLGIAGVTVVIVRKSLLGHALAVTPDILNYERYTNTQSMLNTPPVFAWYVLGLMLDWIHKQGGCHFFASKAQKNAQQLYDIIDNSKGFYLNSIERQFRSRLNIVFKIADEKLEKTFLDKAAALGFRQLKGHKVVGGLRASIYNAMPQEGVDKLAAFMNDFAQEYA